MQAKRHQSDMHCPIAKVAVLLGDMWVLLILRDLSSGARRFSELRDSLEGISTRTLTAKLKRLEAQGLIERKRFAERPPRVEYRLTSRGAKLQDIIDAMRKYGEAYL